MGGLSWASSPHACPVRVHPSLPALPLLARVQANWEAMEAALTAIQHWVPRGATVADLHSGVGTIGLSLAATRQPRWIRFVELNPLAEEPFRHSEQRLVQQLEHQGRQQAQQLEQQGQQALPEQLWEQCRRQQDQPPDGQQQEQPPDGQQQGRWERQEQQQGGKRQQHRQQQLAGLAPPGLEFHVAAAGSAPERWLAGAEVAVVDPPRKGLEPALLDCLASAASPPQRLPPSVRRLVYLSCGLPALRRDAGVLLASGRWVLRHAEAFLFFPGADHVETLVVFDRV